MTALIMQPKVQSKVKTLWLLSLSHTPGIAFQSGLPAGQLPFLLHAVTDYLPIPPYYP